MAIVAVGVLFALAFQPVLASTSSQSLVIQVYSDGSSSVTQSLTVSPSSPSVQVPLLSEVLSDVVVTDQSGAPLSFKISGANITVYTLGASGVEIRYDTQNLTTKIGAVWTIGFTTAYNATLILPPFSTLSYISGTPFSLKNASDSPVAVVGPGTWSVKYGVPINPVSSSTTTGGGPALGVPGLSSLQVIALVVGATAVVGGGLGLLLWRRRLDLGPGGAELRPDDLQVLNFIQEKGGKVQESEIRTRFALPKTSAWRQIKRLERMGYVRVTRIGSQNQIEVLRKREA